MPMTTEMIPSLAMIMIIKSTVKATIITHLVLILKIAVKILNLVNLGTSITINEDDMRLRL